MLNSEKNTPEMDERVRAAFLASATAAQHGGENANIQTAFEHGHWWVSCVDCGAQWDAVDAEGGASVDGFDFEEVTPGDGYCEAK